MLTDGIVQLLTANSGVNGHVSGRVYQNSLPRGYVLPALVVHRYGGTQGYDMAGPVDVREDQIQVDIYAGDPSECQTVSELVRALLAPFVGALPEGTVVQACYLERDMDMPYLPGANSTGTAFRSVLGFRVVSQRV